MSRSLRGGVIALTLAFTSLYFVMAQTPPPAPQQRAQAARSLAQGNYREAYDVYRRLVLAADAAGQTAAEDLEAAVRCLRELQRQGEIDDLLDAALDAHAEDWRLFWRAGKLISEAEHYGFVVAGKFVRADQRGGGAYVDVSEHDRSQSIVWLNEARTHLPSLIAGASPSREQLDVAQFYMDFATALRQPGEEWKLQSLTDLEAVTEIPDGTGAGGIRRPVSGRSRGGIAGSGARGGRGAFLSRGPVSPPIGAPVDEAGNPIFYTVPAEFDAAENDGQRWRFCLAQVEKLHPERKWEVRYAHGEFLHSQFGVQTLAMYGIMLPRNEDDKGADQASQMWQLHTLGDDETIARLATGVKRFKLPDEFNPVKVFREIASGSDSPTSMNALTQLASVYEDRQQYPKAAELWREVIRRFPRSDLQGAKEHLDQIIGNWGQFENVMSQPAKSGATIDFRFRNGKQVAFEAHVIKVPELLADVQKYLESNPRELGYQNINIDNIGYRIVTENETKYLGERVAQWSLTLDPRAEHFDKRLTVNTPLQKGGAYLVTAKMAEGNTTRIILWLNDTAIVKKQLSGNVMYYVADAITGKPANHASVQFFGWQQEFESGRNTRRILTKKFAEFTGPDGIVLGNQSLMPDRYQWIAIAKTESGGFAHLGFSGVWFNRYSTASFRQNKVYVVTDRPVYRPDQKVQFKFWVREAQYGDTNNAQFANQPFRVKVMDPEGNVVFQKEDRTDEFGGIAGEYALPKGAKLGSYRLQLDNSERAPPHVGGGNNFQVEEYKKPEFEVTVDAPSEPMKLGDTVKAKITAKYYYGAPVTDATVKVKVERSVKEARWYPYDRWDWLYDNGYWWHSPDYAWYPGFAKWGCFAPRPIWFPWSPDPPELVLDREVKLQPDGTAEISIDTSLAKALHGNQDHEYKLTVEVTDASRRTITGQGSVLVAREPYKVFSWTHRGHYRVGDTIEAKFQARTLAGKGVKGSGKLQLLKVVYGAEGPTEQVAQEWNLSTNDEGFVEQVAVASAAGQYRFSFKMKTADDAPEVEGGYLFVIRGDQFDGREYRFNDLELIVDKSNYQPGEKVQLLINTNRVNSSVLLFLRPENGVAKEKPRLIELKGKSTTVEVDVAAADMPNFFIEAVTISDGKVHETAKEVVVPPEKRILNVEVVPNSERYLPGQKAEVDLKVTGPDGKPFAGSLVLAVYDRAVEYVSGGSNVQDIKEFFWKWRRRHNPNSEENLAKSFYQLLKNGEEAMRDLGIFGAQVADTDGLEKAERQNAAPAAAPMAARALGFSAGGGGGFGGGGARGGRGGGARMMLNEAADAAGAAPMMKQMAQAGNEAGSDLVAATVRTNFADTAFWKGDITTDKQGLAHVSFDMPENLGSWKMRVWGMGAATNVGEATREVVTAKNLVVRLQSPRFFTEKDEVILSAVVHNYLATEKQVRVQLDLGGQSLQLMEVSQGTPERSPNGPTTTVTIAANGETRVDWRVKALTPGNVDVTMKALTDVESDAMKMSFPVNVHGILKTESFARVIRPEATGGESVTFTVPQERNPLESRLEVRYSPTLAAAMVDALPYLAEFPYGCTEQTLNRFIPTVITQRILQDMGLNLAQIRDKRTNLNAQELGDAATRAAQWKRFNRNPVFDEEEVANMVKKGVQDLTSMQNSDGGWGWFSGLNEHSYPHTTAVVVHGLQLAVQNDVALTDGLLDRGVAWLRRYQDEQIALLQEGERHAREPARKERYKDKADDLDALVFSVLADAKGTHAEMQRFLYRDRLELSLYSQSLFGLALHTLDATEQRDVVVRNIDQFLKVDDENHTAYLDLPNNAGRWWYWHGNVVEANAHYLKLLTKVNPRDPKAAGLVKYLVNNRKNGTYWNSTRDTAYCIESLAGYLKASGEGKPNMLVEVWMDGKLVKSVEITPETLFSFDNAFVVEGENLTGGEHKLELKRSALGTAAGPLNPLYFNAYVTNFTKEDNITAAGLEIKVGRKFYKLEQDKDAKATVAGSRGQVIDQSVLKYNRVELANLDEVRSGDLVEIELEIDSKNDYEYVIFEDLKAAGCEPVDLRSGYTRGGLGAYVEFRDDKVAFFMRQLLRGKHSVSYRVRAEVPGKFSALPAKAHAMYAPELRANSNEMKIRIAEAAKE